MDQWDTFPFLEEASLRDSLTAQFCCSDTSLHHVLVEGVICSSDPGQVSSGTRGRRLHDRAGYADRLAASSGVSTVKRMASIGLVCTVTLLWSIRHSAETLPPFPESIKGY